MKSLAYLPIGATLLLVSAPAQAQTVMEHKIAKPVATQAGPGGGPHTAIGINEALASAGRFNTFLALLKVAGMDDWQGDGKTGWADGSVRPSGWDGDGKTGWADGSVRPSGWDGDGKAGIQDDSVRGVTVLAPNDAAFAAMDKAKLDALMKDRAAARTFLMAYVVDRPLKVADMFDAGNINSEKHFRSASGGELKLLCNGRHDGMHHPRINGVAKVADLQDVRFKAGFVQEIDGLLNP